MVLWLESRSEMTRVDTVITVITVSTFYLGLQKIGFTLLTLRTTLEMCKKELLSIHFSYEQNRATLCMYSYIL